MGRRVIIEVARATRDTRHGRNEMSNRKGTKDMGNVAKRDTRARLLVRKIEQGCGSDRLSKAGRKTWERRLGELQGQGCGKKHRGDNEARELVRALTERWCK